MNRESIPVLFDFTSGVGVAQWGLLVSAVVPFLTAGATISAGTSVMEKMSREDKERSDRLEAIRLSERKEDLERSEMMAKEAKEERRRERMEDLEERRRERMEDRLKIICGATFLTFLVYFLNKN